MDESEIVSGFVVKSKRERFAGFLRSAKSRRKFVDSLYHFNDFDPAVIVELSSGLKGEGVLKELERRGAGRTCYIISADADWDKKTLDLSEAIREVFATVEGTLVSCLPGRLAYYEGEAPDNRFILHRRG